jgi:DNA-binding FadR family transcriptional regulator
MPLHLQPVTRKSIAEQVAACLRGEILAGQIRPGEKLPGERQLAARLGTNRNTLREAMRTLESEGLVRARHGDGVTVLDYRRGGELQVLGLFITAGAPEERAAVLTDLLRLRRLLLVDMAVMAAERGDRAGVAALRQGVERVRAVATATAIATTSEPTEGERETAMAAQAAARMAADLEFYRTLAGASGSLVAQWSFNTLSRAYLDVVQAMPALWFTPKGYLTTLSALVAAIAARDAAATRRILERHLRRVDAALVPFLASGRHGRGSEQP